LDPLTHEWPHGPLHAQGTNQAPRAEANLHYLATRPSCSIYQVVDRDVKRPNNGKDISRQGIVPPALALALETLRQNLETHVPVR
jgi:hypothetical protein